MYVYVLDYVTDRIVEIEINSNDNIEEVMGKIGLDFDNCNYLISERKLEVESYKYSEDAGKFIQNI